MTLNEAKTRTQHIDPQLRAEGWTLNDRTQLRLEVPVDLAAKRMVQSNTTLAMKRMITKGKLAQLLLINPPPPLQQKFARLVERVERLRAAQREALRQAEHLFGSLLHTAFGG